MRYLVIVLALATLALCPVSSVARSLSTTVDQPHQAILAGDPQPGTFLDGIDWDEWLLLEGIDWDEWLKIFFPPKPTPPVVT
jgi:hypothetical protein